MLPSTFEDLYGLALKINPKLKRSWLPHYRDVDELISKDNSLIQNMKQKGKLIEHSSHPKRDLVLPHFKGHFLTYGDGIESLIVEKMKNNENSSLNMWKLSHLENFAVLGWDAYSKILFDKLINLK